MSRFYEVPCPVCHDRPGRDECSHCVGEGLVQRELDDEDDEYLRERYRRAAPPVSTYRPTTVAPMKE